MEIKLPASSTFTLLWLLILCTSYVHLIKSMNGSKKLTVNSLPVLPSSKSLLTTISHNHHSNVNLVHLLNHQSPLVSSRTGLISFGRRQGKDIFDGWGGVYPDKDEDVSKTFSYLMPILLLIAAVTLTIPIIALFFFIFLWKRPPSFLCNVLDPELKNTNNLNAQPRMFTGLINLLLKVDKAFTKGDQDYGSSKNR